MTWGSGHENCLMLVVQRTFERPPPWKGKTQSDLARGLSYKVAVLQLREWEESFNNEKEEKLF